MNTCMHFMHPPKSYKLNKAIMLIFVFEKNRPLLLAKGVRMCVYIMTKHEIPSKPRGKGPMTIWTCFGYLTFYANTFLIFNLRSYVLNPHKLWQSSIVTNQKTPPSQLVSLSQFVINAIRWHIESRHSQNVFCVFGRVPLYILAWIWEVAFQPELALFEWNIHMSVCILIIMT